MQSFIARNNENEIIKAPTKSVGVFCLKISDLAVQNYFLGFSSFCFLASERAFFSAVCCSFRAAFSCFS